jgi:toxin ParE1/3/4
MSFSGMPARKFQPSLLPVASVPEHRRFEVRVTGPAQRDTIAILKLSRREFGEAAALRYAALMAQALRDIGEDPERHGSKERPDLMIEGARTYHLAFSGKRVKGRRVKEPRHFLIYRKRGDVIEVARIVHDSRDLARHVPESYRRK